jgi:hypothetical protein
MTSITSTFCGLPLSPLSSVSQVSPIRQPWVVSPSM